MTAATLALRARNTGSALVGQVGALPDRLVIGALAVVQWVLAAIVVATVGTSGSIVVVVLQVVFVLPLGLVLVHRIGSRLAGHAFAAWAALLWIALPYVGLVYANQSFRHTYAHEFLRHTVGVASDARFDAAVAYLAAGYFALRLVERLVARDAVAAVAATAAGIALAPRSAAMALAPVLTVALGRRDSRRVAIGVLIACAFVLVGVLAAGVGDDRFHSLERTISLLSESFWSGRVLEWLLLAGFAGALRARPVVGLLLGSSVAGAFVATEGARDAAVSNLNLLHALLPASGFVALLAASIPLLWPHASGAEPASVTLGRIRGRLLAPVRDRERSAPLWVVLVLGCEFALILFVGVWNAAKYPPALGFDAVEHMAYADSLLHGTGLPHGTGEFYTPPGFYALAAGATWIGTQLGMSDPHRAAMYLNVGYVLATAALLVVLARLLFPRRPVVWVAALGFFALLPIVAKNAAMFHPEALNMLVSTAGLTLGTWILVRRRFTLPWLFALGVVLAAGQLVRASSLFTFVSVGIAFLAALATPTYRRAMPLRKLAIAFAALVVLVTPWYLRQTLTYHTQPFVARADFVKNITTFPPNPYRSSFFDVSVDDILHRPVRPYFTNQAVSETYVDMWGDWSGSFAWSSYSEGPWSGALTVLMDQSRIGLVPTLLAVAGWFGLVWLIIRRRVDRIPYLPVVLLPAVAMVAYLWKAYAELTPDGDLLGATHILVTAPAWAIAFGYAVSRLARYRSAAVALTVLFLICGALELRFMLYGVREHWQLFG